MATPGKDGLNVTKPQLSPAQPGIRIITEKFSFNSSVVF